MTTANLARPAAPVAGEIDPATARTCLGQMLLIRRFEEKAAELYSAGKIRGFLHLSIGEEAVSVAAIGALTGRDNVVSTYREHGHALVRGLPPGAIMAELFGKANGCSRGRGGSMHIFDAARRFYGGNAIVGGGLPLAVGLALADRLQAREAITMCLFGDGAVAEGEFHESLNLAALWHLPVLFLCENNYYAMGTALERHQAETDISLKATAYRIPSMVVDGMDLLATRAAVRQAVDEIRTGNGPVLLECRTYRFRAHSMYDPELYRSKEEVEQWKQRDPITLFRTRLEESGILSRAEMDRLDDEARTATEQAVAVAEAGGWEPVADLLKDVYAGSAPCA
ncbi:MAG TPA: pyruvate dehydrogenase (acetyl-transferring) E1 component subunit alpha [Gemmatimonadales bacterium]|nr:pyruvate dehydrogenase (acetyl-transferring) E1 component subunit alpha [Gemmatimonadales bacterium]